jgi:hypothetical protein
MQAARRPLTRTTKLLLLLAIPMFVALCATRGDAQRSLGATASIPRVLPFAVGELLTYHVRVGSMAAGSGSMRVEGPVDVRGVPTLRLRSQMRAGVGPFQGTGTTESWLDSDRMTSLRFTKEERRLISRHWEAVTVFPSESRWTAEDGRSGESPSSAPLDELSFIYFIRTLPLEPGATHSFNRHFEEGRNPVLVRVLARTPVTVPAGTFATVLVELRVKDPRHYQGEGTILINLTDDSCRLPVRIESDIPGFGRTVLSLESAVHPAGHCVQHGR